MLGHVRDSHDHGSIHSPYQVPQNLVFSKGLSFLFIEPEFSFPEGEHLLHELNHVPHEHQILAWTQGFSMQVATLLLGFAFFLVFFVKIRREQLRHEIGIRAFPLCAEPNFHLT